MTAGPYDGMPVPTHCDEGCGRLLGAGARSVRRRRADPSREWICRSCARRRVPVNMEAVRAAAQASLRSPRRHVLTPEEAERGRFKGRAA